MKYRLLYVFLVLSIIILIRATNEKISTTGVHDDQLDTLHSTIIDFLTLITVLKNLGNFLLGNDGVS